MCVQSVSEKPISALQGPVCWQQNSILIAGVDRHKIDDKFQTRIIFWEKNGLRHLEFELPNFLENSKYNDFTVERIEFSPDAEILAIQASDPSSQYLLLYVRNNYRWYLKKVIESLEKIKTIFWSQEQKTQITICYTHNYIEIFDFSYQHNTNTQDDGLTDGLSLAISVDNNKVLTSIFSSNIMPPPMSNLEIVHDSYVDSYCSTKNSVLTAYDKNKLQISYVQPQGVKNVVLSSEGQNWNQSRLRHLMLVEYNAQIYVIGVQKEKEIITFEISEGVITNQKSTLSPCHITAACLSGRSFVGSTDSFIYF